MWIIKYIVLCVFLKQVHSKPQITKLFPVQEVETFHQQTVQAKPLDKFLGKLRATYNFIFHKSENTSNVERILVRNEAAEDVQNDVEETSPLSTTTEDWWVSDFSDKRQIAFTLDEPTDEVELHEVDKPELTTSTPSDPIPTFNQHLINWLSSIIALIYGIYVKFSAYFCN